MTIPQPRILHDDAISAPLIARLVPVFRRRERQPQIGASPAGALAERHPMTGSRLGQGDGVMGRRVSEASPERYFAVGSHRRMAFGGRQYTAYDIQSLGGRR